MVIIKGESPRSCNKHAKLICAMVIRKGGVLLVAVTNAKSSLRNGYYKGGVPSQLQQTCKAYLRNGY
jgi:hypothetical protein